MISTTLYCRAFLRDNQKDYFVKLASLTPLIHEWTYVKADFLGLTSSEGILSSVIMAELLLESDLGDHPLAQSEHSNKYSNNLGLLKCGNYWKGKVQVYRGDSYRAYKTWRSFAEDFSDYKTFSRAYDKVLLSSNLEEQCHYMALTKPSSTIYNSRMIDIINKLGLTELDGKEGKR